MEGAGTKKDNNVNIIYETNTLTKLDDKKITTDGRETPGSFLNNARNVLKMA
jgi:hypothetical protein